ncbi:hypothetical protein M4951_25285 [Blastopirellula sp. J2-11]|uniref:DUF6931 family protein n=1 Tax=Blastopirellula sp. J2-11 TaxID=2943192 RepID=UPI0021CAB519|nr:hypothetical protein [Blastopirellula sp. J2-11]UUO06644.1 hypothetical protein M4951_25285 [Blastopirellula sp. J2-11]
MKSRPFPKHDCRHGSHAKHAATPSPAAAPLSPLRGDATAVEICQRYKLQLSYEARSLLTPTLAPMIYIERLLAKELDAAARKFLAAALPLRRSLWWSVLAIHDALGDDPDGEAFHLAPVVQWIARPSEEGLLAIRRIDKQVKRISLWGCLYQAAYSAGGRATSPDQPIAVAPPEMPRRIIAAIISMAASYREPRGYYERQRRYLLLGKSLVQGPAPWTCRNASPAQETR